MTQIQPVATLNPLAVGAIVFACTILIHAMVGISTVSFFRHEKRRGYVGVVFWMDVAIFAAVISFALVAHLIEVALWAVMYVICGEFADIGTAYYHSAVNYTSLGTVML